MKELERGAHLMISGTTAASREADLSFVALGCVDIGIAYSSREVSLLALPPPSAAIDNLARKTLSMLRRQAHQRDEGRSFAH